VAGVILVGAFIVIPGLVGKMLGKSFSQVILVAIAHNALVSVVGLFLSYHLDLPPGPTMVLLSFGIFVSVYAVSG